jgi:hypothetical protein
MMHSEQRSVPLKRIDLYMDQALWDRIKDLGKQRDLSASEIVRRLVAAELKRSARAVKSQIQEPEIPF